MSEPTEGLCLHGYSALFLAGLSSLWAQDAATAQWAFLVEDINPDDDGSGPQLLGSVDQSLLFFADDGVHGQELWKSDGTEAGTRMVTEIRPGSEEPFPTWTGVAFLAAVSSVLFWADDGVHGWELWRSDGSETGTAMVKDILPGPDGGFSDWTVPMGDKVYFSAADGVSGDELWLSDGTEVGTARVKDIAPGPGGSSPYNLTDVEDRLFFTAGASLWKSDGSEAGTLMVKEMCGMCSGFGPEDLTAVAGELLFSAADEEHGYELWRSDGTEAGTAMVKDILPGPDDPYSGPRYLTEVGGTLFFAATDGVHGFELWRSDGTEAGTVMVKDITADGESSFPEGLKDVNGTLFFSANDLVHGRALWRSDGTESGTVMVEAIVPSGGYGVLRGRLFFGADDGVQGTELWTSDGTEPGTWMLQEINPGPQGSSPWQYRTVGDRLFFTARDGAHGRELWAGEAWDEQFTLKVVPTGPGSGTVSSLPPGIDCGFDCQESYDYDTPVQLAVAVDPGSGFTGWGGHPDCLDGAVTMNQHRDCVTEFCSPVDLHLESMAVSDAHSHEVCDDIFVGPGFRLTGTGELTLSAPGAVVFTSPVAIEAGASLKVRAP